MATFKTGGSQKLAAAAIKQTESVDQSGQLVADSISQASKSIQGITDIVVGGLDERVRKGTRESLAVTEAALNVLAKRRSQGRLGYLKWERTVN